MCFHKKYDSEKLGAYEVNRTKGGNSKTYRQLNRGLMLKLIATGVCTSRAELARYTGLTKMAVTNIVSEMLEQQLIEETSVMTNEEVGRNPIRIRISPDCPKAAGVLLMRDRLEVVLCDFRLRILERECRSMEEIHDAAGLMENLCEMLGALQKKEAHILGIGIASIGPVDVQKGVILEPLYFWGKNIPIVKLLKERFDLPVFLNHDNQSGALAELLFGGGSAYQDFLFLGLGRGIGCGMALNGELYENQGGLAAEIGHTSIDYNGEECTCGNRGCIECYASTPTVLKHLREVTGKHLTFEQFCSLYHEEPVKEIFDEVMKKLAVALVNHINLLNPRLVCMGHDGVVLPDGCILLLAREVNRLRFFNKAPEIVFQKTSFGADSQLLGGACQVIQEAFSGRLLF